MDGPPSGKKGFTITDERATADSHRTQEPEG
jgi:hypothetical protein